MADRHFAIDPRKVTLGEYWRAPQRGSFLAGLVIKALPMKIDVGRAVPLTERLIELDPDDLPAAAQRLTPTVAALAELGFEIAFYYREDIVTVGGDDAAVALLSPDGRVYASVIFAAAAIGDQVREELQAAFVSRADQAIVVTSTAPGEMDAPPEIEGEVVAEGLPQAYARHLERIAEPGEADAYRKTPAAVVFDRESLRAFVIALSRRVTLWNAERGVFTPMQPAQVTALRRGEPTSPTKPPSRKATLAVWLAVAVTLAALASC